MRFVSLIFVSFLVFSGSCFAKETSHYDVVAEFIKELGKTKTNQDIATTEMAEANPMEGVEKTQHIMSGMIRSGTRMNLKLRTSIYTLKGMKLDDPFDTLIPTLITWNKKKMSLYDELIKTAKAFIGGPKANVDYSKLTGRAPEITAEMEFADESIFKLTPLVFATLIDQKPDSHNHLSHLIITKEQGQTLVDTINNTFGSSLDENNQNWTVSAASVLRTYLTEKGYKYSDDPWE